MLSIGIGLGVVYGVGGTSIPGANYYVSAQRGDDGNDGSYANPYATFAPLGALEDGDRVAVANGGTLWSGYSTGPTDPPDEITFFSFNDPLTPSEARPIIRCDAIIDPESWSAEGGDLYSTSITLGDDAEEQFVRFYCNGRHWRVSSTDETATTPGMYWVADMHALTTTLYIRVMPGDDPRTNGKVYTYTKETVAIDLWGDDCSIIGFDTYRALGDNGTLAIRGVNGFMSQCSAVDGGKHNALMSAGTVEDCLFKNAYYGAEDLSAFATYLVFFRPNGVGHSFTTRRNIYMSDWYDNYSSGVLWHNEEPDQDFYDKWTSEDDTWSHLGSAFSGSPMNETSEIHAPTFRQIGLSISVNSDMDVYDIDDESCVLAGRTADFGVSDATLRIYGGEIKRGQFGNTMMRSSSGVTGNTIELHEVYMSAPGSNDGSFSFVQMDYGTLISRNSQWDSTHIPYGFILGRGAQNAVFDGQGDVFVKENTQFEYNDAEFDPLPNVTAMIAATESDEDATIDGDMPVAPVPLVSPLVALGPANLKAWLTFNDADLRIVTGGKVQSLQDIYWAQCVTNVTAGNRPLFVEDAGPLGQDVGRFVGADTTFLIDPSEAYPSIANSPWFVAGVMKVADAPTGDELPIFVACITPGGAARISQDGSGGARYDVYAGGEANAYRAIPVNAWAYGTALLNGAFSLATVNGAGGSFANAGTGGFEWLVIGSGGGFTTDSSFDGDMLEVVVGSGALYDLRLALINKYLQSRVAA